MFKLLSLSLSLFRGGMSEVGCLAVTSQAGSRRTSANNPLSLTAPLPGDRIYPLERVGGIRELLYLLSPSFSSSSSFLAESIRHEADTTTAGSTIVTGRLKICPSPLAFRKSARVKVRGRAEVSMTFRSVRQHHTCQCRTKRRLN